MAAAAAASSSGGGGGGDGHGGAVVPLGKPLTAVLLYRSAALDVILLILFPSADAAGAFAVGEAAGAAAAAEVGHFGRPWRPSWRFGGRLPSLASLAGGLDGDTTAGRPWTSAASRASERVRRRDSGYEAGMATANSSDSNRDGSAGSSSSGGSGGSNGSNSRDGVQGGGGGSTFGLPLP